MCLMWGVLIGTALSPLYAQQDTTRRPVTLPAVSIVQQGEHVEPTLSQTPMQVASTQSMQRLGDAQLSDALRRMAGVTLKDYGGIGGVKTVSARGLGSQFSTLTIDGVAVTDCQNGQVDLGRYLLEGSSQVSFSHGQPDGMLHSARTIAAGSIVDLQTLQPDLSGDKHRLRLNLEGGSYGYLSPTIGYDQRLGRRWTLSAWANHTRSDGDYPFTLYYTASRTDSSARLYRQNSQMAATTADANLFYRPSAYSSLHLKAHYLQAQHQLPGPVIYYTVKGSERTAEQLFFGQARYRRQGEHWNLQLLAKYQTSHDLYEDTAAAGHSHILNLYQQQEAYLSQALHYQSSRDSSGQFHISLSADQSVAQLQSNLPQHSQVQRLSALGVLAARYIFPKESPLQGLRADAHLLGTWVRDYEPAVIPNLQVADPYARLSPYAGLTWTRGQYTLRYFFKETYRVPNFNELYYYTVGHALHPERAKQHNLGITYRNTYSFSTLHSPLSTPHSPLSTLHFQATLDGYYNRVADKIIAVPMQNMYLWSMSNLGRAEMAGFDLTLNLETPLTIQLSLITLHLTTAYSYQYAVDRTDPSSKTYGHQIPYTPRHNGSLSCTAETPWLDVGLTLLLVGHRYSMQQNTPASRLPGYADQGITLSHTFYTRLGILKAKAQVLNLFNVQYEVVRNYPMMGRNYRLGLSWQL